jgi:hypothetical protein
MIRENPFRDIKAASIFKVVLAVFVLSLLVSAGGGWFTPKEVVTKVTDTETKMETDTEGNITDKYLAFTDAGVFENTDSWYHWKFNSSDVQNDLKKAEKGGYPVKITYYWVRSQFLSSYQNIIKVETVGTAGSG